MSLKQKTRTGRALCNTWGADPSALPVCNHADCQLNGGTTKGRHKKAGAGPGFKQAPRVASTRASANRHDGLCALYYRPGHAGKRHSSRPHSAGVALVNLYQHRHC